MWRASRCSWARVRRPGRSSDELLRQANAAFLRGDLDEADRLYRSAEETATDPGLVAFNRAAILFQQGQFRDAELLYKCVLEDRDCPTERQARAWYNRGTCLLRRCGTAAVYRLAIADLERCIEAPAADEPLKADARHNLELAKIQWNNLRKTNPKPENPNENTPDDTPDNTPDKQSGKDQQPGMPEPGNGNTTGGNTKVAVPQNVPQPIEGKNNAGAKSDPGNTAGVQPLQDTSTPQPLSPEDTREHLKRTEERLRKTGAIS